MSEGNVMPERVWCYKAREVMDHGNYEVLQLWTAADQSAGGRGEEYIRADLLTRERERAASLVRAMTEVADHLTREEPSVILNGAMIQIIRHAIATEPDTQTQNLIAGEGER